LSTPAMIERKFPGVLKAQKKKSARPRIESDEEPEEDLGRKNVESVKVKIRQERIFYAPCTYPSCEKTFTKFGDLRVHVFKRHVKHLNKQIHPCVVSGCGLMYTSYSGCYQHFFNIHAPRFQKK